MSRIITTRSLIAASLGLSLLTGCEDMTAVGSLPNNADAYATTLAEIKDDFDEAPAASAPTPQMAEAAEAAAMQQAAEPMPVLIVGLGYAQIARQQGGSLNQKRLLALRAARMDALRDLTEQVHGIHITASTTISDLVVQDDHLQALVQGTIRGARTVRITPKGTDGYEVELALDADTVAYIVRATRGEL